MLSHKINKDGQSSTSLSPAPFMPTQIGFGCKTRALFAALTWMYQTGLISERPLPDRKRAYADYKGPSLRWYLKRYCQSAVGEVNNIEDIAALAEIHHQVAAYYCECTSKEEFITTLMKSIDQARCATVYYDIGIVGDEKTVHRPVQLQGRYEHAALVVGYYYNQEKKLIFRVSTWGKYYDYDADQLYQSTCQLPKERADRKVYFKMITQKEKEGAWLSAAWVKDTNFNTKRLFKHLKETSPTQGNGLCGKILILDSLLKPGINFEKMPVKFSRPSKKIVAETKEILSDKEAKKDEREKKDGVKELQESKSLKIDPPKNPGLSPDIFKYFTPVDLSAAAPAADIDISELSVVCMKTVNKPI